MNGFNWFDTVLLLILVVSTLTGLRAGLARLVVGLLSTVLGFVAGFWGYRAAAGYLLPFVQTESVANVLGFLIIFVGVMIAGSMLGMVLSRLFRWIGLSWFNHLLGGLAGILRGALVIAALVDVAVAFAPSPTPLFISSSRVLPYTDELSGWVVQLAPRELKDMFREQMENLKRYHHYTNRKEPQEA